MKKRIRDYLVQRKFKHQMRSSLHDDDADSDNHCLCHQIIIPHHPHHHHQGMEVRAGMPIPENSLHVKFCMKLLTNITLFIYNHQ